MKVLIISALAAGFGLGWISCELSRIIPFEELFKSKTKPVNTHIHEKL